MESKEYQILDFAKFNQLLNWSVAHNTRSEFNFNKKYRAVKIGDVIKRNRNKVNIKNDKEYQRVTIKLYGKGVTERDRVLGNDIGTKNQYKISPNQFIISKIDARNGAFGIVPEELAGAITTQDFLSYNIDEEKIKIEFLNYLTHTTAFLQICQTASSGTTGRKRIDEKFFLNLEIPLPSLLEQQSLVEAFHNKTQRAKQLEQEASKLDQEIENYLFNELGIEKTKKNKFNLGKLNFIEFREFTQWGVSINKLHVKAENIFASNKYSNKPIRDFFAINPTTSIPKDKDISFIPMPSISDNYGEIIATEDKKLKSGYTKFKEKDIIWARITPCMENGKSAYAVGLKNDYGFGSTEFHVLRALNPKFHPQLLHRLLRTKYLRDTATNYFTGSAGQQRVPKSFLEKLTLPFINDFNKQISIVEQVEKMAILKKQKRNSSIKLKSEALIEFENTIFKI